MIGAAKRRQKIVLSIVGLLLGLVWFFPILWMFFSSLQPNSELLIYPPRILPRVITLENFRTILFSTRGVNVGRSFLNSVFYASLVTLGVLVTATPAAYAFARMEFRGRDVIFWLIVATLILPVQMFIVPVYLLLDRLGLLNTIWSIILPPIGPAFGVFLLRQFMLTIPDELEDAAKIDGCSPLRFLVQIVVPLMRPPLASLAILTFLGIWNDLLWPMLVITDSKLLPLQPALTRIRGEYHGTFEAGTIMAGAFVAAIPVLVIFSLASRYIVRAVSTSGISR
ncbi:MAG: carbohydrate ABC transporter permease [Limnochordia bacterium]|nr:carbohydrate ABC transporter permease [Limnochordia bacterium]NLO95342.1 carbohydrate ABC transporter permease [Bacillota bacterium]HOB41092.1 carbohydrate ABC transporter permease [Limnochordia bacterium]HOK31892.1 carbohydrate ABC transporter permease [Limnochordia bacterium]HOQ74489.1 carbohydrate ABC transporter permease [Limnochordia bacterium]